ncbi:MAG: hypothetical protein DRN04_12955 [Thermoprotei archaeon]|nr:MAG: hypothetical protein DRN04_12955 [Thermoprotei archaeon]
MSIQIPSIPVISTLLSIILGIIAIAIANLDILYLYLSRKAEILLRLIYDLNNKTIITDEKGLTLLSKILKIEKTNRIKEIKIKRDEIAFIDNIKVCISPAILVFEDGNEVPLSLNELLYGLLRYYEKGKNTVAFYLLLFSYLLQFFSYILILSGFK